MALLGKAAMIFWHGIEGDEADYNHWHAFEHIGERVGIEGFHRGRRYGAVWGGPKYFNMYETSEPGVLTSKPYLDRLNDPSPWTTRSIARFTEANRTLCRVTASHGTGLGGAAMTVQLVPAVGRAEALREWLGGVLLAELVRRPGIVGAHLLEGDGEASRLETAEKSLREAPDEISDWAILIEALSADTLTALAELEFSSPALIRRGAAKVQNVAIYNLLHVVGKPALEG